MFFYEYGFLQNYLYLFELMYLAECIVFWHDTNIINQLRLSSGCHISSWNCEREKMEKIMIFSYWTLSFRIVTPITKTGKSEGKNQIKFIEKKKGKNTEQNMITNLQKKKLLLWLAVGACTIFIVEAFTIFFITMSWIFIGDAPFISFTTPTSNSRFLSVSGGRLTYINTTFLISKHPIYFWIHQPLHIWELAVMEGAAAVLWVVATIVALHWFSCTNVHVW